MDFSLTIAVLIALLPVFDGTREPVGQTLALAPLFTVAIALAARWLTDQYLIQCVRWGSPRLVQARSCRRGASVGGQIAACAAAFLAADALQAIPESLGGAVWPAQVWTFSAALQIAPLFAYLLGQACLDFFLERRLLPLLDDGQPPVERSLLAHLAELILKEWALLLFPLGCLLLVFDLGGVVSGGTLPAAGTWVCGLGGLSLALLGLPWLQRRAFAVPLEAAGEVHAALQGIEQAAGRRPARVLLWDTGGRLANAALCGFLPRSQFILLSDRLVQEASPAQVAAVYAHELGHFVHRHAQIRLLAIFAGPIAISGGAVLVTRWLTGIWQPAMSAAGMTPMAWAVGALTIIYFVTIFAWVCRVLERQADGFAIVAGGSSHCELIPALELLDRLSLPFWGQHLLHGSLQDRVRHARRLQRNPALAGRYNQQVRLLTGCLALATLWGLLLCAWLAA